MRIILYNHFSGVTPGYANDIMLTFFCPDEDDRYTIHLFQPVFHPDNCTTSDNNFIHCNHNDDMSAHAVVLINRETTGII